MHSSTSSSEVRFVTTLVVTFFVLIGAWELVLRQRAGAAVDVGIDRPPMATVARRGERWVIFGNCLMMTGVSPRRLGEGLGGESDRTIVNIASHEQSPIAFFDYLRRAEYYPDAIITNVSSWINGTNFEQEATLVARGDPLGVLANRPAVTGELEPSKEGERAFSKDGPGGSVKLQEKAEELLSRWMKKNALAFGHRYHLFDYSLFLGTLLTSANLDNALYQLNVQSWFRVTDSETDGFGYLGLQVRYRDDWPQGVDLMAERYLKRLRLSRLLTPKYWTLLEDHIRNFQSRGTQVFLIRMPEHPRIRDFNDQTYELPERLRALERDMNVPILDLSHLGPADGVHLFDAVHPDEKASEVTTRAIAQWLRSRLIKVNAERPAGERAPAGG
jgi:hypothetical protein